MKKLNLTNRVSGLRAAIAVIMLLTLPLFANAQAIYKTTPGSERTVKVKGTSNVHDWVMETKAPESQGKFTFDDKGLLKGITAFTFAVDAKSLKSEHSTMNTRAYKAMKADEHPRISYKLTNAVILPTSKMNTYLIRSTGDLTIGGVTQPISMDVTGVVNNNNTITCSGSKKIKLTDHKISPPSYMAGAMKVGNELNIDFNLAFKK